MLRIWLIDDDDSYVMLAERALSGDPRLAGRYEIERKRDGDEALRSLGTSEPLPDLILLDHRMPRMDGTEVLSRIRGDERLRGLPVCMMSTSSDPSHIERCYAYGATFCVSKPLEFEQLVAKLRAICGFVLDVMELPDRRAARPARGALRKAGQAPVRLRTQLAPG